MMSDTDALLSNLVVKQQVTNELLYQLLRASNAGEEVSAGIMADLNEAVHERS